MRRPSDSGLQWSVMRGQAKSFRHVRHRLPAVYLALDPAASLLSPPRFRLPTAAAAGLKSSLSVLPSVSPQPEAGFFGTGGSSLSPLSFTLPSMAGGGASSAAEGSAGRSLRARRPPRGSRRAGASPQPELVASLSAILKQKKKGETQIGRD